MKAVKITKTILLLFPALLLTWPMVQQAEARQLHNYVDRDSVRAGDLIRYTIVFDHEREFASIRFPDDARFEEADLTVVNRERHRVSADRDSIIYHLQYFGIEDFRIPRLQIEVTDNEGEISYLETLPIPIRFISVLADGEEEFRPLKPIFDFAAAIWPWILFLLVMLFSGWLIHRYYLNRETEAEPTPPPPPIPFENPLQILERSLHALSGSRSPLKESNFKEFYVRLGDAIRLYIEVVYDIGALEMTSGEILDALSSRSVKPEIKESTRNVLMEADLVKFARFEPDKKMAENALEYGWAFLETARIYDHERIEQLKELHQSREDTQLEEAQL